MTPRLSIRSWTEPYAHESGVAVIFDIFRCSTTIHTLFHRGLGPLYVAPSLKEVQDEPRVRDMRVFSELSQPVTCRERYDNSPFQAERESWAPGVPSLVATTTGTPALFSARRFRRVYVGSLVNFSALVGELARRNEPVTLVPAALPDWDHVEDEITAQAMATALEGFATLPDFVRECAISARAKILESPRPETLARKLAHGREDIERALEVDRYDHVLWCDFAEERFAAVKKL